MNHHITTIDGIDPFSNRIDAILAEIAFSVQLPPSLHDKAVGRYDAVRKHLEATSSSFCGQIEHFYPQGSMAIDATISNRGTDDEYDLDIVAQLGDEFLTKSPNYILTELEKALIGYRGAIGRPSDTLRDDLLRRQHAPRHYTVPEGSGNA